MSSSVRTKEKERERYKIHMYAYTQLIHTYIDTDNIIHTTRCKLFCILYSVQT